MPHLLTGDWARFAKILSCIGDQNILICMNNDIITAENIAYFVRIASVMIIITKTSGLYIMETKEAENMLEKAAFM